MTPSDTQTYLAIMKLRKKIRREMDKQVLPERCARPSRPLGKRKYSKSESEESESDDQRIHAKAREDA